MAVDGSFKELKNAIFSTLIDTTRTAGQISNEDLAFHRSSNPSVIPLLEQQNSRLLQLARRLTHAATAETEITAPLFSDPDSVEDNWRPIVDVFDNLLEKADACLDEYTGVIRRLSPGQEEKIEKAIPAARKQKPSKAYQTHNIAKPQLLFEQIPTNDDSTPFRPLLRSKPHAITPFQESLTLVPSEDGSKQYKHPYEIEIKRSQFPASAYMKSDPIPYLPYETTKATFVETPEALMSMLQELKSAKEIAVDLEHHDEHSYIGLVSLMQISTRDKDWIVDTLKPWRQELQILNEVFADPQILKVFHGASMDIIWLQRDFGLYVVGLFDTFHASRSLRYPKNGLAYLLKRFANFDAAKQYQMADWRIRPLPEEMFDYARSDTHFLLYVYDNMRNELIENSSTTQPDGDLIEVVMNNSKAEALQRYERPIYDHQTGSGVIGWYHMLCRTPALFSREQFAVFRAVHQWRDTIARQADESVHQIMPKHVLYNIAREMPLDMSTLVGCSHPMSKIFRERKGDLLGVIRNAKVVGSTGPVMKDVIRVVQPVNLDHIHQSKSTGTDQPTLRGEDRRPQTPCKTDLVARADTSRFWGLTVHNPNICPQGLKARSPDESLCLALPLPQLTAEVFEDRKVAKTVTPHGIQTDSSAHPEHQYIKARKPREDDVFVVKEAGGSRKRKVADTLNHSELLSGTANNELLIEAHGETDEMHISPFVGNAKSQIKINQQLHRTTEQKYQRKPEKKRLKEEKLNTGLANIPASEEVEAFDYANAPSVLHAKPAGNDTAGGVNPYAKSRDAPKGMRKTKREIGGKNSTFKG